MTYLATSRHKNPFPKITSPWREGVMKFTILTDATCQRGRTTNGKIGPVADQIYEIWNCTIFVI